MNNISMICKKNLRRHSCATVNHFYLIFGLFLVSEFVSSLSFCCPGKLSFAMFFRFMFSQAISRSGDLPTYVTGMRDLTGNVVCSKWWVYLFLKVVPLQTKFFQVLHSLQDKSATGWTGPIHSVKLKINKEKSRSVFIALHIWSA